MSLRPTFLGFESAKGSLFAAQKALDITGNNIANIETDGYTRQRVDFFSIATSTGGLRYSSRVPLAGQGVNTAGVSQLRDPFLDKRYRELQADASEYSTVGSVLIDIEDVLDNIETEGLQDVLLTLQSDMQSFATDAADRVELAGIVQMSALNLTQMLHDYDKSLTQIADQAEFVLDASVEEVNNILEKLAGLNEQIVNEYYLSGAQTNNGAINEMYGPNELLDTRNLLLDELSQYGDIVVDDNPNGSINVQMAGVTVVDGKDYQTLLPNPLADPGTFSFVFEDASGTQLSADFSSGIIKGYMDMLNGNGPYAGAGQSDVYGIPYYQSTIDAFAQSLADAFNLANGADDGLGNVDYASGRLMFDSQTGGAPITAANIRISDAWQSDAQMIAGVGGLDANLDNTQILQLLNVFDQDLSFGMAGDFTGTFEEYISFYTNRLGQQTDYVVGQYDTTAVMVNNILDNRDAVSAVSMDEEGINMLNYQKWLNASSRIMTTLDEALDTIINNMGIVGR